MLEFFATDAPDPPDWTLNSCFGTCRTVRMLLGPFHCLTKLGAKRAEMVQIMQKFMPRSRVGIFCNECSRSTSLEPELRVWCVSFHLGAFGSVSLLHKTCCKTSQTGAINAKVRATKSCRNFSQRTHPIQPIVP